MRGAWALVASMAVAGCLPSADVARPSGPALERAQPSQGQSALISALQARRSVLAPGALSQIATAVLAADAGVEAAELRAARLRSEAEARNWLPTLGPQITLTSLGGAVAQLAVDQVLFDNGGKKAARAFARADVEVAAVTLSQAVNDRVLAALALYLDAQAATARADVLADGLARMERFAHVMARRVEGGVNDRADLKVVEGKLARMRSDLADDRAKAGSAWAELAAMGAVGAGGPAPSGLSPIGAPTVPPLRMVRAEAEARRAKAKAQAARAGLLPQLGVTGVAGTGGGQAALTLNGAFGPGSGARMQAASAEGAAAEARVDQAREQVNRQIAKLNAKGARLAAEASKADAIAAQAAETFDVFDRQLRAGLRTVPEVVGLFETKLQTARTAAALPFAIARVQAEQAALHGVLVDGGKI